MPQFLADENVPADAIVVLRNAGFDVLAVAELAPRATDSDVIDLAVTQGRALLTLDKDFGELAFRMGRSNPHGVILFRPRLKSPEYVASFMLSVLQTGFDWSGHFFRRRCNTTSPNALAALTEVSSEHYHPPRGINSRELRNPVFGRPRFPLRRKELAKYVAREGVSVR